MENVAQDKLMHSSSPRPENTKRKYYQAKIKKVQKNLRTRILKKSLNEVSNEFRSYSHRKHQAARSRATGPHQDVLFFIRVLELEVAGSRQHSLDGAHAVVVVEL